MILEPYKHKTFEAGQFWLPLDNAAKIFPATITDETTTVFRITAVMKQRIKIKPLMKAISKAETRFPYFKVRLQPGFFWYFLEYLPVRFPVEVDNKRLCRRFPDNNLLLRILVAENNISVEFAHILTDGTGAMEFLKTILILYSVELGASIPETFSFFSPENKIEKEEYEDAYNRYFKENIPPMVKKSKAFHLPFTLNRSPRFKVMHVYLSIKDIKAKAKEKGVSITDYLVAVYLYAMQEIYEETTSFKLNKKNKVIRIQVPVNLRNIFPSKTMRNFSLFVMPDIDLRLGKYSFEEIVRRVYHQIRLETDKKLIAKNISRNVGSEKKIYVKSIPLVIKSFILKLKYYSLGTSQYSGVITNMGKINLPPDSEALVDHFKLIAPPPNKMLKINCGVIGFNDKLVMSFGNITRSSDLENKIIRLIKAQKIKVYTEVAPSGN